VDKVILRRGHVKPVFLGHPWVFRKAVARLVGSPGAGDLVAVEDAESHPMGLGWWHPESAIAVRLLPGARGEPDRRWFAERFEQALAVRRQVVEVAPDRAFRLVNSEGDGLPGVVVDLYGRVAVVGFSSLGAWQRREVVVAALEEVIAPEAVVLADVGARPVEGVPSGPVVLRGAGEQVTAAFSEHGVRHTLRLPGGHKTGAYLDQAANRGRIARLAPGRRVLDLFCYHGGFGLAAARAGAAAVFGVDSSGPALRVARAAAQDNGLEVDLSKQDVQRWLRAAAESGARFDLVVSDPPPLARLRRHADQARSKLLAIHRSLLAVLAPGGLLLTCSCSRHLDHDALERVLTEAARDREVRVLQRLGAGPDHPVRLPCVEGRYLSALLCGVV